MNTHPGNPLLKAVIANPDDDLTRLVYADWLDENGQPERAEFIRVQVALAAGVEDEIDRARLEGLQRELLVAHEHDWVSELAAVLQCQPWLWGGWVFRRGFVDYFHLPAVVVLRCGEALAERTPLRALYLNPVENRQVVALCRCPWMAVVRELYLNLGQIDLNAEAVRALIHSPHTRGLKRLVTPLATLVSTEFEEQFRGVWSAG